MLKVEHLTVHYGAFRALEDVSLAVQQGQVVSIVGANGAGKSTLINAISGLLRPTQGSISFDGVELTGLPAYRIARMGVVQVPEGRSLFDDMSVRDNLLCAAMHPRARPKRLQTLEEVYALFPVLRERSNQLARTLSGGERQMLAIGRGLMAQPRVLMLDEPSLGLAPLLVRQIFESVRQLKERGLTILLVEQNVRQSLLISDYAYVLEVGRLVLEGPAQEMLRNPYVREAYLGH
ncbi:MAG: ABC transporter ATP-binding protein [Chloroflexia bacterium]